jgi:regulator of replication initiation timing
MIHNFIKEDHKQIKEDVQEMKSFVEQFDALKLERDDLMKALKHLVIVAQKDEINKDHLDQALRKARNVIADIDPTVEKCDCCY